MVMYALLRRDLHMTAGKACSQAGHAFVDSLASSPPAIAAKYAADGGTKVVLTVDDEEQLRAVHRLAVRVGMPCALVVESGHVMPPTFDGTPIITALGIGPVARSDAKPVVGKFKLMD